MSHACRHGQAALDRVPFPATLGFERGVAVPDRHGLNPLGEAVGEDVVEVTPEPLESRPVAEARGIAVSIDAGGDIQAHDPEAVTEGRPDLAIPVEGVRALLAGMSNQLDTLILGGELGLGFLQVRLEPVEGEARRFGAGEVGGGYGLSPVRAGGRVRSVVRTGADPPFRRRTTAAGRSIQPSSPDCDEEERHSGGCYHHSTRDGPARRGSNRRRLDWGSLIVESHGALQVSAVWACRRLVRNGPCSFAAFPQRHADDDTERIVERPPDGAWGPLRGGQNAPSSCSDRVLRSADQERGRSRSAGSEVDDLGPVENLDEGIDVERHRDDTEWKLVR